MTIWERLFKRKALPALTDGLGIDDLIRARLRDLVEKDPEFRSLMRHAVRVHLEVMRDELVSLAKTNEELVDTLTEELETIDEFDLRITKLEEALLKVRGDKQ